MFVLNGGVKIERQQQEAAFEAFQQHFEPTETGTPESLEEAFARFGVHISHTGDEIDSFALEEEVDDSWRESLQELFGLIAPMVPYSCLLTVFGDGKMAHKFDFFGGECTYKPWMPGAAGWLRYALQLESPEAILYCCERALEIEPEHIPSLHTRALALMQLQRLDEALKQALKAEALVAQKEEKYYGARQLHLLLAQIYTGSFHQSSRRADLQKAEKACLEAVEMAPEWLPPQYDLACVYALMERPLKALERLSKVLAEEPSFRSKAEGDEDFASLRGLPEFRRLLEHAPRDFGRAFGQGEGDTSHGAVQVEVEEIGQLSIAGELVACDPASCEETKPLAWRGPRGRYKVLLATATSPTQAPSSACVLLLSSRERGNCPASVVRWEPLLLGDEFLPLPLESGALGLMTPASLNKLQESPKRHQKLCDALAQRSADGELRFSGGKLVACAVTPGVHKAWWGLDASNEAVCLLLDFGVLC